MSTGLLAYLLALVVVLTGLTAAKRGPLVCRSVMAYLVAGQVAMVLAGVLAAWGLGLWMQLNAVSPPLPPAGWVRADNLNGIMVMAQGWGSPAFGRSVGDNPLRIGNETYENGIGTHAEGEIRVPVPPYAAEFTASVGLDAEATGGLVEFEIVADGESMWKSGPVRSGPALEVHVPVAGRHELKLLTHALGDDDQDHADWANPSFHIDPPATPADK